jgi:ABC-type multidrug transport system permease subunit
MMRKFISKCDFISPNITLYYRGEENHSSMSSGLISIFLIITIIFFIIYLSFDFKLEKTQVAIIIKHIQMM